MVRLEYCKFPLLGFHNWSVRPAPLRPRMVGFVLDYHILQLLGRPWSFSHIVSRTEAGDEKYDHRSLQFWILGEQADRAIERNYLHWSTYPDLLWRIELTRYSGW